MVLETIDLINKTKLNQILLNETKVLLNETTAPGSGKDES